MGQGGFVYCTASRQINSSPTLPPLIIAEQKMCVYSYNSASFETLWTGMKANRLVDGSEREREYIKKKEAGSIFLKMQGLI